MESYIVIFDFLLALSSVLSSLASPVTSDPYDENASILIKCITGDGRTQVSLADLKKIESYDSWNGTERVPCFSHCLSVKKGWFDPTSGKWIRSKLEADLSENVYKYCEEELESDYESECDFAYKGFRCLRQAAYYTAETYMTLLTCAIELHANLKELQKYSDFSEDEHVPCLFKCFAHKLNFYTSSYDWNFENWKKALGPWRDMDATTAGNHSVCRASPEKRKEESATCDWMYKEYVCLKHLNKY